MEKELLLIKRGYVYEFEPKTEFSGKVYALAVSADRRGLDNVVSIILLSRNPSPECIEIANSQFAEGVLYCNCGKATSTERDRLTREVFKIADKKMKKIDSRLSSNLGLNPLEMEIENKVYKELYHELLERVIKDGKTDIYEN